MAIYKIPDPSALVDCAFFQVPQGCGHLAGFLYDRNSHTLYTRESQVVIPGMHGLTHISEDPIPVATCDTPGLESADDKCKLDALVQMRLGVLGWQGAGWAEEGGFLCFPPESQVSGPDSTSRPIKDIKLDDEVITHTGKIQKVSKLYKRHYDGKLLKIWASGHHREKFACTPEHPILAIKNKYNYSPIQIGWMNKTGNVLDEPVWIQAKDLKIGDYIARKFASNRIIDKDEITISDTIERIEVSENKAYSREYCSDSLAHSWNGTKGQESFRTIAKSINNTISIGPEFLRLCGYYLSEGHTDGNRGIPKEINFSVHRDEAFGTLGADISYCCEFVFGVKPTIKQNTGNGCNLCVYSATAARFMKQLFPGTAHSKKIPQWMMELPPEKQKWLLYGFLEGDGYLHIRKKSKEIGCGLCSEQLINQLCALAERQGGTPILTQKHTFLPSTQKWYTTYCMSIQASDLPWLWHELGGPDLGADTPNHPRRLNFSLLSNNYTLRRINTIEETNYTGDVYNLEVAGDNSYIVNNISVHNCGDVILAAGSEFIQLERIGNTIRFVVDTPIPLCSCESCAQIFWVQDESETRAIRPPSCNGLMPNVSAYGELKIYLLPESTIVDPGNPMAVLANKGQYPTLTFKRYNNSITPYEAQYDMVLKRNSNYTTNVGWSFTPPSAGSTLANCCWFTGSDKNGAQLKFELWPSTEPGILGSILANGNLITKKPAVIVDYTANILSDNVYTVREWDIKNATYVGDRFNATNVWRYQNPETTKSLVLDATVDLLPIGTIVDLYQFEISRSSTIRITRSYFSQKPGLNATSIWSFGAGVQFGDLLIAREEINNPISGTAITASEINISDIRLFERTVWGLTQFQDRLLLSDDGGESTTSDGELQREPSGDPIDNNIVAEIDPTIPGLRVTEQHVVFNADINGDGTVDELDLQIFACAYGSKVGDSNYRSDCDFNQDGRIDVRDLTIFGQFFDLSIEKVSDRPVFLWHRGNHKNIYAKIKIGQPTAQAEPFPPYDFLISAPADSFDDVYLKVIRRGVFNTGEFAGLPYIVVKGQRWKDLPPQGILRVLSGAFRNTIWRYYYKCAFSPFDDDGITLIGRDVHYPFDYDFPIKHFCVDASGNPGTGASEYEISTNPVTSVSELLHQDYTSPAVRFQFGLIAGSGGSEDRITLQLVAGTLSMHVAYPLNSGDPVDDLVRGFTPGYTVSKIMMQDGFITDGVGAGITSDPSDFRLYSGGELPAPINGQTEKWNDVEIMFRNNQLWVWINGLLIPPDPTKSAQLPYPVVVSTPYFPVSTQLEIGKFAMRMFPGAIVRAVELRDQNAQFNEYTNS